MSVAVKICGVCRPEDAGFAAAAGADYIGVILAPGYGRSRSLEHAGDIFGAAPDLRRVGVFVDPGPDEVGAAAERLRLDVVQLHGTEPPEMLSDLRGCGGFRIWKAIRPRGASEFLAGLDRYARVSDAILLDGWSRRGAGGTGARFPWDEIASVRRRVPGGVALVAAGGLDPLNVGRAVERLAPDIVDVSSGVERTLGVKDPERIHAFIAAARQAAGRAAGTAASTSIRKEA